MKIKKHKNEYYEKVIEWKSEADPNLIFSGIVFTFFGLGAFIFHRISIFDFFMLYINSFGMLFIGLVFIFFGLPRGRKVKYRKLK